MTQTLPSGATSTPCGLLKPPATVVPPLWAVTTPANGIRANIKANTALVTVNLFLFIIFLLFILADFG
jgi:hypothetical protein